MLRLIKAISLFFLFVLSPACQRFPASNAVGDSTFRKPTATEAFNLRTKCAELGDEILRRHPVQPPFIQEQTSHYDPKTNRCYVDLLVTNMDQELKSGDYIAEAVYDGQSRELLASVERNKGKLTVIVKDGPLDASDTDAYAKIKSLMADDRKQ
jgi:hypothetical protein